MIKSFTFLSLIFMLACAPRAHAASFDFDAMLKRSSDAYARVNDYVCRFSKKERIRDDIHEERNIIFKYRKPAGYYMKWTEGNNRDTEVMFVEGKYDNKLQVRLGGFFGFVRTSADPKGPLAMRNNRHSIKESGMGHILDLISKNYQKGKRDPECSFSYEGGSPGDGGKAVCVKAVFPAGKGYYGHKVQICIDKATSLPVKLTVYGWKNEFLEEYRFDSIRPNVGLTDRDFDIGNPEYRF